MLLKFYVLTFISFALAGIVVLEPKNGDRLKLGGSFTVQVEQPVSCFILYGNHTHRI
jgi:hypothetical protein